MKASLLMAGLAEASANRCIGALFTSGLLGFIAPALALAAAGRTPTRTDLGGALGFVSALPLLGAALLIPSFPQSGTMSFLPALPAFMAMVALTLAGASASPELPEGRASALAATTGVPIGLAFVSAAVAALVLQTREIFQAVAGIEPASKLALLVEAAHELHAIAFLSTWGWAFIAVPILALGAWGIVRGAVVRAPIGEVGGVVVVALLVAAADLSAVRSLNQMLRTRPTLSIGRACPASSRCTSTAPANRLGQRPPSSLAARRTLRSTPTNAASTCSRSTHA